VRSEAAEKVDLSGLEVRGSRLADQVHGALEIYAGGEGAAHLVGEPERTKILRVAGGDLERSARGFGEKGYGLVGVRHSTNALVMVEVETLERPEAVIRAFHILGPFYRDASEPSTDETDSGRPPDLDLLRAAAERHPDIMEILAPPPFQAAKEGVATAGP
jgi:hypothetical protein